MKNTATTLRVVYKFIMNGVEWGVTGYCTKRVVDNINSTYTSYDFLPETGYTQLFEEYVKERKTTTKKIAEDIFRNRAKE